MEIKAIRLYSDSECCQVFLTLSNGREYEAIKDCGYTIDHWLDVENGLLTCVEGVDMPVLLK
jgi:hypothetical protein